MSIVKSVLDGECKENCGCRVPDFTLKYTGTKVHLVPACSRTPERKIVIPSVGNRSGRVRALAGTRETKTLIPGASVTRDDVNMWIELCSRTRE